ncbi:MAG: DNA primase [Hyphomicrobium sp.]|nr:DNA primase [Hyphomicrobium sp.]
MRFPPQILDEIRARLSVSQVVGRRVALKKKGREWVGLSPFKAEKTPSFYVNDQKGFYHCFSSGEHGDIFTFLMKTEGLEFPEAVERLAADAGVTLPKPEPRDREFVDERQRLLEIVAVSQDFFVAALGSSQGLEARRYLERRGVRRETIQAFGLGFAPPGRRTLLEHLRAKGYALTEMIRSGMIIGGEDIAEPYDRFRNRVMFPIADLKGRPIAFGGRALDPDAPAKYLNSPETPLFHKGANLYNAHRARPLAHEKNRIIAVEGYMDVVAMTEAGVGESVAPLGTALTEDQLKLLWRMTPEPVLCFDGDSAGKKAAWRAIDVALPHLRPGQSIAFAFLPDGLDPDDLVRQQGSEALEGVLTAARPMADVLFEREWAQGNWSTPERRAGLEQQVRLLIARIEDPAVRHQYEREMRQRLAASWASGWGASAQGQPNRRAPVNAPGGPRPYDGATPWRGRGQGAGFPGRGGRGAGARGTGGRYADPTPGRLPPSQSLVASPLARGDAGRPPDRELLILRAVLNHVWLAEAFAEEIAALPLTSPALARLRDAILSTLSLDNSLDSLALRTNLASVGLGAVVGMVDRSATHKCDRFAEPDTERTEVEVGWRHALALHDLHVGLKAALESAERAWHEDRSEDAYGRIREIKAELERLGGFENPETRDDAWG